MNIREISMILTAVALSYAVNLDYAEWSRWLMTICGIGLFLLIFFTGENKK